MGGAVTKTHFNAQDYHAFQQCLQQQLQQLRQLVRQPDFGKGPLMLGAELEMYLVDKNWQVACKNQILLNALDDPLFQPELNQYNLELNSSAFKIADHPFTQLLNQLKQKTDCLLQKADELGINVVPIGILPTLKKEHLHSQYMTDIPRYRVLTEQLAKLRGSDFNVNINGEEPLSMCSPDVTAEGANTSFQVHMMVQHEHFADVFNAAQLTLPFTTAIAANSAILLGNKVWDETRIALFKQSLDVRKKNLFVWQPPARVSFGLGWVRKDCWELFAEAVANYKVLIPDCSPASNADAAPPALPKLKELNLHMGTIWPWNRPVYSNEGQGHVRIEFRALPAGPTNIDMVANAAFSIGLAVGMAEHVEDYISCIAFTLAEFNFYRAAQHGLDAKIRWPIKGQCQEVPIVDILQQMLPVARQGLQKLAVDKAEIERFIGVIERRLATKNTGARWQKQQLGLLDQQMPREQACKQLVALYSQHALSGKEVSEWPMSSV